MANALLPIIGLWRGTAGAKNRGGAFGLGLGLMGLDFLMTKKQVVQGPRLSDRSIQVAELGWRLPSVYGTHRTAPAIIWAPRHGLTEHVSSHDIGSGKQRGEQRDYSYGLALRLSRLYGCPIHYFL